MGIIRVAFYPGAEEMFADLPEEPRAKAIALARRLDGLAHQEIACQLDSTTFENCFQHERRIREGGLRVVYAWGQGHLLWILGAYIKRNNKEGERLLKTVFATKALEAKNKGLDCE